MNPKRLGFQVIDVHFGTFDYTLHVIVGPWKNVLRYVRWKMDNPDIYRDEAPRGACFMRNGCVPVLWIPRKPKTPREHSALAHEMLHAVRQMLVDWAGVPLNGDTDEAFCHALGYGVATVLEAVA